MLHVGEMGRVDRHGREIFTGIVGWAILVGVKVRDLVVASPWGSTRSATGRDVDEESFVDGLAAGVVGVEGLADGLFGAQGALVGDVLVGRFATDDLEGDVGGVDAPPEGIGVFAKNDISNAVDEVVFGDFNSCGRGTGSFHPYLSEHCWKTFMTVGLQLRDDGDAGGGRTLDDEQRRWRRRRRGGSDGGGGG